MRNVAAFTLAASLAASACGEERPTFDDFAPHCPNDYEGNPVVGEIGIEDGDGVTTEYSCHDLDGDGRVDDVIRTISGKVKTPSVISVSFQKADGKEE